MDIAMKPFNKLGWFLPDRILYFHVFAIANPSVVCKVRAPYSGR